MKHISIDYHFVRDHVARGSFKVSHISSKEQLADALTKPLSSFLFKQQRSKLGVSNGSTVLRGRIKDNSNTSATPASTSPIHPTTSKIHSNLNNTYTAEDTHQIFLNS